MAKLVRDNIPEIIRRSGELPILGECKNLRRLLCQKLVEETCELKEEHERTRILSEFADVKEVLDALYRDRKMVMRPLRLSHMRVEPELDASRNLYIAARVVRRSVAAQCCLERFYERFEEALDAYAFCEPQLLAEQAKRRDE
ncbi:MAG TPA: hypothetical protein VFA15_00070, partial [Nitrososphaera sp.]|nr:hypothetical protein [Nitrososphaera sp.]